MIISLFLIAVVGLAAQSQAPAPIAVPPDILTTQTAASISLVSYKAWLESSLSTHDTAIQNLWSAKVADEATIEAQGATINLQGTQISAMQAQIASLQAQLMPVISAVLHIEAESAAASSGAIVSQVTTDAGGGLNLSNIADGQWFEYHINVPVAGSYTMTIRAATPNPTRLIHVEFPVGTNQSGAIAVPNTGGYQAWTTVPVGQPLAFPQGTAVFRVVCDTGRLNLNYFEFVRQ